MKKPKLKIPVIDKMVRINGKPAVIIDYDYIDRTEKFIYRVIVQGGTDAWVYADCFEAIEG